MKVLSLDPGFGDCKISYLTDLHSKPEYFKHVNVVARLGEVTKNRSLSGDASSNVVEMDGQQYLIGHSATQATNSQVMPISDYDTLKDVSPLILKKYLNHYKDVDKIVVSLSLAYLDKSGDYKRHLVETLELDEKKISLVPQGVGCKIGLEYIGFNVEDPTYQSSFKNYLGIDLGYNTIDVIKVIDGNLISQNIQGFPGMGVVRVVNKLKGDMAEIGLSEEIPLTRIKVFLNQGFANFRGKSYDMTEKITKRIEEYILEIKEFLEREYKEDLNNIDMMVLFGGGANLIRDRRDIWNQYYEEGFVKIPHVGAEFYNSLGGLYYPTVVELQKN